MCNLCANALAPTTDVLFEGLPLAVCSNDLTAIMMYAEPWETLVNFDSGLVYSQAQLAKLRV